jgi:thymidylate kinase
MQEARLKLEIFENLEELKRTRCKALALASIGKWTILDANKSAKDLGEEIENTLDARNP